MVKRKRSVFTYGFKGRARRQLFWKKKIYRLWYRFAKEAPKIPEEFGDLSKFDSFEEWWKHPDYGFELFCEPVEDPPIREVKKIEEDDDPNGIYLRVNLNEEPQILKFRFSSLLKRRQRKKKIVKPSQARFQPSAPAKSIKEKRLKYYIDIWIWRHKEGYSRAEAWKKYHKKRYKEDDDYRQKWNKIYGSDYEIEDVDIDDLRYVSRACQRVREIFKNIERGTFP